jgi:hypothetical protein
MLKMNSSIINKTTPNTDSDKITQVSLPPTSSLLTSFLPFSIPVNTDALEADLEDSNPLPAHTPLPETPELITLFSPLTLTSILSQPTRASPTDSAISQTHSITLTSPGKYLGATFDMIIGSDPNDRFTKSHSSSIDVVTVKNLSAWAAPELDLWMAEKAADMDIISMGYGLGRYWDVCLKRGQCWGRIRHAFPQLVAETLRDEREDRDETRKRKRDAVDEFGLEEVARDLGRQVFTLESRQVVLKISWAIEMDWAGDVISKVAAKAAFPGSCKFVILMFE